MLPPTIPFLQPTPGEPVGLLAGWGNYPIVVAEALKRQGCRVICAALRDHADPRLAAICDQFSLKGLGSVGGHIRFFRRHDVCRATMSGKVHKARLFDPLFLWHHFPDWTAARTFAPHFLTGRKDRKDDTLLTAIVEAFARRGIAFVPATDFVPELLVKNGVLTGGRLTAAQKQDIRFGWMLAREMGRLDVGQSVAVKGRAVLAVEAVEGTDECIRRAGTLCRSGRFTVVKVAKPNQDMRFDVPTIGLGTLETMREAGAVLLAVEAGRTIVLDEPQVVQTAQKYGITLVALDETDLAAWADAA